jgi:hypothetical protein
MLAVSYPKLPTPDVSTELYSSGLEKSKSKCAWSPKCKSVDIDGRRGEALDESHPLNPQRK